MFYFHCVHLFIYLYYFFLNFCLKIVPKKVIFTIVPTQCVHNDTQPKWNIIPVVILNSDLLCFILKAPSSFVLSDSALPAFVPALLADCPYESHLVHIHQPPPCVYLGPCVPISPGLVESAHVCK